MNLNYIEKLIKLLENSSVEEIEISSWGKKLKISKRKDTHQPTTPSTIQQEVKHITPLHIQPPTEVAVSTDVTHMEVSQKPAEEKEKNLVPIKSPMIGTFYRAPSPDAKPFVEVGDIISIGQVLCIIEAMKIFNELESDVSGKIVKIMVENAKPVEYGQTLFLVEPTT